MCVSIGGNTVRVACVSIGYPNFRYDIAQDNLKKTVELLRKHKDIELFVQDTVLIREEAIEEAFRAAAQFDPDLFLLELGTYSYGSAILSYCEYFKRAHLLLWAFREPIVPGYTGMPLNSLCALNMCTSFLHRMKVEDYSYIYGDPEEEGSVRELCAVIEAVRIRAELRKSKFCVVGGRVPGFYLSDVDELEFRRQIGPQICHYSIAQLLQDARDIPREDMEAEKKAFCELAPCSTASEESLEWNARIYRALRNFAAENQVSGYALKCWPDFQELCHVAICGVVARLNQEGFPTACEGDVTGLATLFIQSRISPHTVFLSDLVNITRQGTVKVWHCGCASPSLADSANNAEFTDHPTMKQIKGLATKLALKPGRVTLCKLSEGDPYRLMAVEGRLVPPDRELVGNQGDVEFDFDPTKLLDLVVEQGMEHHYCVAYECDMEILKKLSKLLGARFLTV